MRGGGRGGLGGNEGRGWEGMRESAVIFQYIALITRFLLLFFVVFFYQKVHLKSLDRILRYFVIHPQINQKEMKEFL